MNWPALQVVGRRCKGRATGGVRAIAQNPRGQSKRLACWALDAAVKTRGAMRASQAVLLTQILACIAMATCSREGPLGSPHAGAAQKLVGDISVR